MRFSTLLPVLLICFFAKSQVYAQAPGAPTTGSIAGKLIDSKKAPVAYATVTLLRMDSSVVNGDLSKDDGSFNIAPTGIGSFRLRIESIGITTKYVPVQVTTDAADKKLGNIQLGSSENTLGEVSVVGEKAVMELKVDKKVFNVEKNTTTAGGSAADVLQNVPSVSVDAEGNVALRGKTDVTILIDGKPSTLLGTDVASALQSLPAGSIESVEVITNPSAKYDAQGTSGIINIVTKKDGRFGMNGNVTLGAGTGDKYNGNLGLNVRKGKWSAFLNSNVRINNTYNNVITTRARGDSSYYTYEHVPRDFNGAFNTIGVTYDPDKNNSITLTENLNFMGFAFKDYSDYNITDTHNDSIPFHQNRNTDFAVNLMSLSSAIDYRHKFKKKDEELSVDATVAFTDIHRTQDYTSNDYSYAVLQPNNPIYEDAPATGGNSTINVWADYTDPLFTKNGKLGLGFKSQLYSFNSSGIPHVDSTGKAKAVDSTLLAEYNYTQQIHAAYVNWSDQLNKFSYQLGLRAEDALYDGSGNVPLHHTFHNSFFNLFPSAFVSYQLENQQSIYLNYSLRTNRPNFMQLLPFKDVSNPGTVNVGNPDLIPEFINNIEFSYSKSTKRGDNFIISAYYAYTKNLIEKITDSITTENAKQQGLSSYVGELLSKPVNIASGTTYGLEGTGHVQLLPIWDATVNLNFFENQLIIGNVDPAYKGLANNNGFTWFGKVNTTLKLPKNFSFQVNANYESPKVIAQGTLKETYWVDVALRKNLWKNKATLVLNCSDVFKTHQFVTNYTTLGETINRVKETRIGNITFTYRFGKSNTAKKGKPDDKGKLTPPTDEDRDKNLKQGDDNDQGGGGQGGGGTPKGGGTGGGR